MKEVLTEKVAPDFGCKLDKKFKILGNIDLPISHYFVGQNNVYSNSKEFAIATIDNVYIVYTDGFKYPYIQFEYRVKEGTVKKKWFGYFDIDDIYIGSLLANKLTDCRQVAITEYAHIKEREYIDLITEKIGKRMNRTFSSQIQFIDFKDVNYNAPLDMIDVVELASIDIEPY